MIAAIKSSARAVLVLATTALCGLSAQAADRYVIDGAHSDLVFMVDHLGYSMTIGRMNRVEGEILFDESRVENSAVEIAIDAASLDTNHKARDDDLRSANFFNVERYPRITFKSTAVEATGENTGRVTGDLTLLAVTRPVTLEVTFNRKAPHPIPSYDGVITAGFSARTRIRRSDFGMDAYVPAVGDEVELLIEIEAFRQ
jgi:polyisoprenoid-binding protein YceI